MVIFTERKLNKISRCVSVRCFYEVMTDYGVVGDVKNLKARRERGAGRRRGCPCQVTGGTAARWTHAQTHEDKINSTLLCIPLYTPFQAPHYIQKLKKKLSIYHLLIDGNQLPFIIIQRNILR